MRTNLKKPCNECPFRKTHPPGWLGPWEQAGELIVAAEFHQFPCHQTIKPGRPLAVMEVCGGAARFMANKCALPRDRDMAEAVKKVGMGTDVFADSKAMIEHHEQPLSQWVKKTMGKI